MEIGKAIRSAAFPAWGSRGIRCGFLHFIRMSFWLCPVNRGGKRVMKAHMNQVHFFEVEEERELWDVDTLE